MTPCIDGIVTLRRRQFVRTLTSNFLLSRGPGHETTPRLVKQVLQATLEVSMLFCGGLVECGLGAPRWLRTRYITPIFRVRHLECETRPQGLKQR